MLTCCTSQGSHQGQSLHVSSHAETSEVKSSHPPLPLALDSGSQILGPRYQLKSHRINSYFRECEWNSSATLISPLVNRCSTICYMVWGQGVVRLRGGCLVPWREEWDSVISWVNLKTGKIRAKYFLSGTPNCSQSLAKKTQVTFPHAFTAVQTCLIIPPHPSKATPSTEPLTPAQSTSRLSPSWSVELLPLQGWSSGWNKPHHWPTEPQINEGLLSSLLKWVLR